MTRKLLVDLRCSKNLKQKDVAQLVGITTSYYGMIEQGVRNPNLQLAIKIAELFDKNVEEIFFANANNILLDVSLKQTTA